MNNFLPVTILSLYGAMVQSRLYVKVSKLFVTVRQCTWTNIFFKGYSQSKFSHSKSYFSTDYPFF